MTCLIQFLFRRTRTLFATASLLLLPLTALVTPAASDPLPGSQRQAGPRPAARPTTIRPPPGRSPGPRAGAPAGSRPGRGPVRTAPPKAPSRGDLALRVRRQFRLGADLARRVGRMIGIGGMPVPAVPPPSNRAPRAAEQTRPHQSPQIGVRRHPLPSERRARRFVRQTRPAARQAPGVGRQALSGAGTAAQVGRQALSRVGHPPVVGRHSGLGNTNGRYRGQSGRRRGLAPAPEAVPAGERPATPRTIQVRGVVRSVSPQGWVLLDVDGCLIQPGEHEAHFTPPRSLVVALSANTRILRPDGQPAGEADLAGAPAVETLGPCPAAGAPLCPQVVAVHSAPRAHWMDLSGSMGSMGSVGSQAARPCPYSAHSHIGDGPGANGAAAIVAAAAQTAPALPPGSPEWLALLGSAAAVGPDGVATLSAVLPGAVSPPAGQVPEASVPPLRLLPVPSSPPVRLLPGPPAGRPLRAEPPAQWSVASHWHGRVVSRPPRGFSRKLVALTFDDGPHPTRTAAILETLARFGVKATFFVLGCNAQRYPNLVREIVAGGPALAAHSFSHPRACTPEQAEDELSRTAALLVKITGHAPQVFRPPYGILSNGLAKASLSRGYAVLLWSNDPRDWEKKSAEEVTQSVLGRARAGDIVLFHDGVGDATPKALPTILASLRRAGYEFATVPEMLRAWDDSVQPPVRAMRPARRKRKG